MVGKTENWAMESKPSDGCERGGSLRRLILIEKATKHTKGV